MTANNTGGMYRANDISQGESCSYAEASPVVGIDGWTLLPSNNYTVTMNALAKVGSGNSFDSLDLTYCAL